jgi:hypothetical protein
VLIGRPVSDCFSDGDCFSDNASAKVTRQAVGVEAHGQVDPDLARAGAGWKLDFAGRQRRSCGCDLDDDLNGSVAAETQKDGFGFLDDWSGCFGHGNDTRLFLDEDGQKAQGLPRRPSAAAITCHADHKH